MRKGSIIIAIMIGILGIIVAAISIAAPNHSSDMGVVHHSHADHSAV